MYPYLYSVCIYQICVIIIINDDVVNDHFKWLFSLFTAQNYLSRVISKQWRCPGVAAWYGWTVDRVVTACDGWLTSTMTLTRSLALKPDSVVLVHSTVNIFQRWFKYFSHWPPRWRSTRSPPRTGRCVRWSSCACRGRGPWGRGTRGSCPAPPALPRWCSRTGCTETGCHPREPEHKV